MRAMKYSAVTDSTASLPSISPRYRAMIGHCRATRITPSTTAISTARPSAARTSASSPAPDAWATKPVVPMRRKPKLQ